MVNLHILTIKLCLLISTYPTLTLYRDIDKQNTAFTTTVNSTSNAGKLVNLRSQTTKFCCLISNHSSLTLRLRLLCTYMIMQLRSGHVTLLRTKFQSITCPLIGLTRRAASRWALPYISSFG